MYERTKDTREPTNDERSTKTFTSTNVFFLPATKKARVHATRTAKHGAGAVKKQSESDKRTNARKDTLGTVKVNWGRFQLGRTTQCRPDVDLHGSAYKSAP